MGEVYCMACDGKDARVTHQTRFRRRVTCPREPDHGPVTQWRDWVDVVILGVILAVTVAVSNTATLPTEYGIVSIGVMLVWMRGGDRLAPSIPTTDDVDHGMRGTTAGGDDA